DQVELGNGWVGLQRQPDSIDDDTTSVVATHDIHYDSHKSKERNGRKAGCALEILCPSGDGDDLASFIKAASGADPVRDVRGGTLRAGAELREFEHAIVSAAH